MKLSLNLFTYNLTITLFSKNRLWTCSECCKSLGCDSRTFYRYVKSGKIKAKGYRRGKGRPASLYDINEARAVIGQVVIRL